MKKAPERIERTGSGGPSKSALPRSSSSGKAPSPPRTILPRDWRECLSLFIKHKVRFVIVGAHALAALGKPLNTSDIDVFMDATRTNARRIAAALRDLGFDALAAEAHRFATGSEWHALAMHRFGST